jgi:hypothetical protein
MPHRQTGTSRRTPVNNGLGVVHLRWVIDNTAIRHGNQFDAGIYNLDTVDAAVWAFNRWVPHMHCALVVDHHLEADFDLCRLWKSERHAIRSPLGDVIQSMFVAVPRMLDIRHQGIGLAGLLDLTEPRLTYRAAFRALFKLAVKTAQLRDNLRPRAFIGFVAIYEMQLFKCLPRYCEVIFGLINRDCLHRHTSILGRFRCGIPPSSIRMAAR